MQAASSSQVARSRRGLPKRACGATTKGRRAPCRRPAGWGTDHPGTGRCKNHGGSSPSGRKAAAKEELADFMAAAAPLLDVDPIEALLYAVRRASAIAAWLRRKVSEVAEAEQLRAGELHPWAEHEARALGDLAKFSKMALDAGVAERRVRMAEAAGALIAQAFEDALAEIELPPSTRARLARAVQKNLALLEATVGDQGLA